MIYTLAVTVMMLNSIKVREIHQISFGRNLIPVGFYILSNGEMCL